MRPCRLALPLPEAFCRQTGFKTYQLFVLIDQANTKSRLRGLIVRGRVWRRSRGRRRRGRRVCVDRWRRVEFSVGGQSITERSVLELMR